MFVWCLGFFFVSFQEWVTFAHDCNLYARVSDIGLQRGGMDHFQVLWVCIVCFTGLWPKFTSTVIRGGRVSLFFYCSAQDKDA